MTIVSWLLMIFKFDFVLLDKIKKYQNTGKNNVDYNIMIPNFGAKLEFLYSSDSSCLF